MMQLRRSVPAAVAAGAVVLATGYALVTEVSPGAAEDPPATTPAKVEPDSGGLEQAALRRPVLVRAVDRLAPRADEQVFELSPDGEAVAVADLACKRVYAVPDGAGLCLRVSDDGVDYEGVVLDGDYTPGARFRVQGVPDRARVSPDGRYGAYTSFDAASSQGYFENTSEFTTYTRILDMRSGKTLLRLEDLRFEQGGKPMEVSDERQLWGVTFGQDGEFYATLANGSDHFLIAGSVDSDVARVIRNEVECPDLSPDGTRIAYKKRIGYSNRWRYHVYDLESRRDVALAEKRSIDDQPEWLDDERIVYSDDKDLYAVPADGAGSPTKLAANATSPASLAGLPSASP